MSDDPRYVPPIFNNEALAGPQGGMVASDRIRLYEPAPSTMVMVEGEPRWADRMPDAWITVGEDGVSRFTAQEPGLYRFDGAAVWRVREV